MAEVGIRALKQNASEVVARAARGEVIVITDRGRPVAQILPLPKSPLQQMIDAGLVTPATLDVADLPPPVSIPGFSLSEEIINAREQERS
ncbi:MAG: type II toxin-antitoxin system prevent-host-death family antitoxin [Thermomicrobiales bacterium]|nr:type II toxin-antitoxin system prevent-host-death family antitoxin [Thermomicrobiales bacterium]